MLCKLSGKLFDRVTPLLNCLRYMIPCVLAGSVYSLIKKLTTGEFAAIWETMMISVWLAIGCINLVTSPIARMSMKNVLKLIVKAVIWPWYLYRDTSKSNIDKYNIIKTSLWIMLGSALWLFIQGSPDSNKLPPNVQEFISLIQIIGMYFIFGWVAHSAIVAGFSLRLIIETAWKCLLLWTGAAFISHSNKAFDSILESVRVDPAAALTMLLAVCFVIFIFRFAPQNNKSADHYAGATASRLFSNWRSPSNQDLRFSAAHEAGHAILYASLNSLPNDVSVVLHNQSGTIGSVSATFPEGLVNTSSFIEWRMLLCLSGHIAIKILYGEYMMGSSWDMNSWHTNAKRFMENGMGAFYFNSPEDNLEAEHNQSVLQSLFDKQQTLLYEHLSLNRTVLMELADVILAKKELCKDDLIPFLSRVRFKGSFPKDIVIRGIN